MAHKVFICYASRDKNVAEAVCDALESSHIKCWIAPRDVLPGMQWAESIVDALDESRILVLVLSSNSNRSPQVIREVGRAAGNDIPIIPLRIDDVIPSKAMDYFVSSHHWLDAQTGVQEKHLKRLAGTVQQILGRKGAPEGIIEKTEAEAEEKAEREAEEVHSKIDRHILEFKDKEGSQEERVATTADGIYDELGYIHRRYSDKLKHDKILFAPDIPERKLANALKNYANIQGGERPLVLVDDTVFGSAKDGLLVTDQRIYVHEPMEKPRSLAIQEIKDINFKKRWTGRIFYINGTKFWTATQIGTSEVEELTNLLKHMALNLRSIQ